MWFFTAAAPALACDESDDVAQCVNTGSVVVALDTRLAASTSLHSTHANTRTAAMNDVKAR